MPIERITIEAREVDTEPAAQRARRSSRSRSGSALRKDKEKRA